MTAALSYAFPLAGMVAAVSLGDAGVRWLSFFGDAFSPRFRASSSLIGFVPNDPAYDANGHAKKRRQFSLRDPSLGYLSYQLCLVITEASMVRFFALLGCAMRPFVSLVLRLSNPCQVIKRRVADVTVEMRAMALGRSRADEGFKDKDVQRSRRASAVHFKTHCRITPPHIGAQGGSIFTPDTAQVRDFMRFLKANYRSPIFHSFTLEETARSSSTKARAGHGLPASIAIAGGVS